MEYVAEKFRFIDMEGKVKEFESVPYSFDMEENIIIKRFGKETIEEFAKTHLLNYKIHLADIKEDFPKLLQGDLSNIDLGKQSGQYFDEIKRVYHFYLEYDSNIQLRLSGKLTETIISNLNEMKSVLSGITKIVSIPEKDN